MSATYKGISLRVDQESLGDIAFETFEPLFRAELEYSFPGVSIEIECGIGSRIDFYPGEFYDESLVHECSERAFAKAIAASA